MSDPDTPALRALEGTDLTFEVQRTERARSAEESASFQGIELGQLLRTIVIRRGEGDYVFVLVPGGRQIDWPKLRAHLGVKRLSLPDAEEAKAATGYERGAITPFGATNAWPVIADVDDPGHARRRYRRRRPRHQPAPRGVGPRRVARRRSRRRHGSRRSSRLTLVRASGMGAVERA